MESITKFERSSQKTQTRIHEARVSGWQNLSGKAENPGFSFGMARKDVPLAGDDPMGVVTTLR